MKIFISRHGESNYNLSNLIGGDSDITKLGVEYALKLENYFRDFNNLVIITSNKKRCKQTVKNIKSKKTYYIEDLNEIFSGIFEHFNLDHIKKNHRQDYDFRNFDKLNNSYPKGESYLDLKKRVFKTLDKIDFKQDKTYLILTHKAVSRVIYAYFSKTKIDTNLEIKINTLYKLNSDNKLILCKL